MQIPKWFPHWHSRTGCVCRWCLKSKANASAKDHTWNGCTCIVCGLVNEDVTAQHSWINCRCQNCGLVDKRSTAEHKWIRCRSRNGGWEEPQCTCECCGTWTASLDVPYIWKDVNFLIDPENVLITYPERSIATSDLIDPKACSSASTFISSTEYDESDGRDECNECYSCGRPMPGGGVCYYCTSNWNR
jgi:hypothetical protein